MKITLVDEDLAMVEAWADEFKRDNQITGMLGDPLRVQADALVCPGDGFGRFESGLALRVRQRWPHVVGSIRHAISCPPHYGELALGHAVMVPTGTLDLKWLIYTADCSGFGMFEHGPDALQAFRATRGALSLIRLSGASVPSIGPVRDVINSMVIPAIIKGHGEPGRRACARQMAFAIRRSNEQLVPMSHGDVDNWISEMNG